MNYIRNSAINEGRPNFLVHFLKSFVCHNTGSSKVSRSSLVRILALETYLRMSFLSQSGGLLPCLPKKSVHMA